MAAIQIIIILALMAVFVACFCIRLRRSHYWHSDSAEWTGNAIDVTELKSKIDEVRRDYHAFEQSPKGACFHTALLQLARRAVVRSAYFRGREPEEHAHTNDP